MDYYWEICDLFIKPKSKKNHFRSEPHKELVKCKHMKLAIENLNINIVDKTFYAYIIEHNKKYDYYLVKCGFEIVFNDYEFCPYLTSEI